MAKPVLVGVQDKLLQLAFRPPALQSGNQMDDYHKTSAPTEYKCRPPTLVIVITPPILKARAGLKCSEIRRSE